MPFLKRLQAAHDLMTRIKRAGWKGDSAAYWEERYARGDDSGAGSQGKLASFKAEIINALVSDNAIQTVIEFGCGDGRQLQLANYPRYVGFDVSASSVAACRRLFQSDASKRFDLLSHYRGETADLALSLDVIFHLIEQPVYEAHMRQLFRAAERFVIVYSSNTEDSAPRFTRHVRHHRFTDWVSANEPGWVLLRHVPNRYPYQHDHRGGSWSDFYVYRTME